MFGNIIGRYNKSKTVDSKFMLLGTGIIVETEFWLVEKILSVKKKRGIWIEMYWKYCFYSNFYYLI